MPKGMIPKETLRKLQDAPESAVSMVSKTLHLAIHPQYLGNIKLGIINYLNNEINRYIPKLDGILLGYRRTRLMEPKAEVLNEEHYLHLDIYSQFWVFRPLVDSILSGVVNKKSPTHISVLIHGLFNVPCHKNMDISESSLEWMGGQVSVGDTVKVRILRMDISKKVPFLLGELYETATTEEPQEKPLELIESITEEEVWEDLIAQEEEEAAPLEEEPKKKKKKKKKKARDEEEGPKLGSSFVLSKDIVVNSTPEESPILTQAEEETNKELANGDSATEELKDRLCQSLVVPKKKKKKKKNRSLSPSCVVEEEPTAETLSAAILATLNKSKKPKSSSKPPPPDNEEHTKEDLSNSLILEMLAKGKKKKKSKNKGKEEDSDTNDTGKDVVSTVNDTSTVEDAVDQEECKALSDSLILNMLNREKKPKKRKSEIIEPADAKRKRSDSESSSTLPSKKPKLEPPNSPSAVVLHPPSTVQEPRLPAGWSYSTGKRKAWFSPQGKKFNTLKSALESSK